MIAMRTISSDFTMGATGTAALVLKMSTAMLAFAKEHSDFVFGRMEPVSLHVRELRILHKTNAALYNK